MAGIILPNGTVIDTSPDDVLPEDLQSTPFDPNALGGFRVEGGPKPAPAVLPAGVTSNLNDTGGSFLAPSGVAAPGETGGPAVAPPPAPPPIRSSTLPPEIVPPAAQPQPAPRAPAPRTGVGGGAPRAADPPAPAATPAPLQTDEEKAAQAARETAGVAERVAAGRVTAAQVENAGEMEQLGRDSETEARNVEIKYDTVRKNAETFLASEQDKVRNYEERELFDGQDARQVVAWLSVGLGGIGAALAGGPNQALQIFNTAVERFAQKERRRYERLVANGEMAKEELEHVDVLAANAKAAVYEKLANRRNMLVARHQGREAAAQGDVLTAALLKKAADERLQVQQGLQQRINERKEMELKERQVRTGEIVGAAQANAANASAAKDRAAAAAAGGAAGPPAELIVTDGAGRPLGVGKTPKATADASESLAGREKFHAAADKMVALLRQHGTQMTGEVGAQFEALRGELLGAARSALFPGGGSIDKGFVDLLESMVPNPAGWGGKVTRSSTMAAKLMQSKAAVDREARSKLAAAGIPANRLDPRAAAR